jgi:4-hydroxy-tetrahydrodipicolinate reductase
MKIAIIGATGRMGKMLLQTVFNIKNLEISGALAKKGDQLIGTDVGDIIAEKNLGIKVSDNMEQIFQNSDAVIDFSTPSCTMEAAELAAKYQKILVSGSTPMNEPELAILKECAKKTVIIWSSNMSIGVNLLMKLSNQVAKTLDAENYDAEILEMHHNQKVDSPSGTATSLGKAIAEGREDSFDEKYCATRDGVIGKRAKGEIGFATLRGGDVIGDHHVIFAGDGERVEMAHKASNRKIYANGATRACIWAKQSNKKRGLFSMLDVLS